MEKRVNEYQVNFQQLKSKTEQVNNHQKIELLFKNHDDVFKIIDFISEKGLFKDQQQVKQFVIGLKLFGDVMMKNRDLELFSEIQSAFVDFMKKLKEI